MDNNSNNSSILYIDDGYNLDIVISDIYNISPNTQFQHWEFEGENDLLDVNMVFDKVSKYDYLIAAIKANTFKEKHLKRTLIKFINLINSCLESNIKKTLFITEFTPYFGVKGEVDEKSVRLTSDLDIKSCYLHNFREEIERGREEGLRVSCILSGQVYENSINENLHSLLATEWNQFEFISKNDLKACISHFYELPDTIFAFTDSVSRSELKTRFNVKTNILSSILNYFKSDKQTSDLIKISNNFIHKFLTSNSNPTIN